MITGTTPGIFVKHPSTLADESWSMQLPDLALLPSFVLKVLFCSISSIVDPHVCFYRQLPLIVTVFVTCGVSLGFLLGFFVHKVYRAWVDVEAEEKRREFQALYADPHTEIEDLPTDWPKCVPDGT